MNQRTDELVIPLLGPTAEELDLLPLVCRLDALIEGAWEARSL